jgi:hypothetical protein
MGRANKDTLRAAAKPRGGRALDDDGIDDTTKQLDQLLPPLMAAAADDSEPFLEGEQEEEEDEEAAAEAAAAADMLQALMRKHMDKTQKRQQKLVADVEASLAREVGGECVCVCVPLVFVVLW